MFVVALGSQMTLMGMYRMSRSETGLCELFGTTGSVRYRTAFVKIWMKLLKE